MSEALVEGCEGWCHWQEGCFWGGIGGIVGAMCVGVDGGKGPWGWLRV